MTYEYNYEVTNLEGGLLIFSGFLFFVGLAFSALMIVSMWKIFEKAGQPGWAAIVPIYNLVVLLQIVNLPLWYIVLLIIPFVNILAGMVISALAALKLAPAFGKDTTFAVLSIFFPFVTYPILAFSDATYTKPE